ncbi:MAG: bifunctional metallophosphatase/5'-nucleotidase [Acidobacteria bacterium]|nr:bifunctional metallophosphatase/5'-nucleotidase [Acidobacteriota bacterium]
MEMNMLTVLAAAGLALGGTARMDQPRHITLAYIADLHAQVEEHPELFWHGGKEEIAMAGGLARIAKAVELLRKERPGEVLFMDAGDTFQGSAAADWSKGEVMIPPLNALGLDLAIPGNWEVVYGAGALRKDTRALHYPTIAANILDARTGKSVFPRYAIRTVNGVRIAVIGFTDPDVPRRQPPDYSAGLKFENEEILQPLIDELRPKVDVLVLLTHIGLPKSVSMAERLKGVDVLLSGDTHERTYEPIVRGNTWVVEPGSFGSFLGRLDLTVAQGRITGRQWRLMELRADRFAEDPHVAKIVEASMAPYRARIDRVIGRTEVPLMRYEVAETSLDKVLTDALREAGGTQIALSNGFRFSAPILPGPIRESDLWNAYPIVGMVKVGKVTGKQLRDFWERELEHVYASDPRQLFGGWLPRTSGMTVRFVAHAPFGRRVQEIRVNGKPIRDDEIYTVTSCDREGDPPDTICRIPQAQDIHVLAFDEHEAVRRFLAKHSPVTAAEVAPGRIVAEDLPPMVRSQYYLGKDQAATPAR